MSPVIMMTPVEMTDDLNGLESHQLLYFIITLITIFYFPIDSIYIFTSAGDSVILSLIAAHHQNMIDSLYKSSIFTIRIDNVDQRNQSIKESEDYYFHYFY